jgi:hypothetical protein
VISVTPRAGARIASSWCHDVAHLSAAAAGERSEEGAVSHDDEVLRRLRDHEVVFDANDVRSLAAQHASAQDVHRLDGGGAVEGGCRGGAPVDDQRLVVVVAHPQATDVAGLAVGRRALLGHGVVEVEAPEHEAFVLGVEDGAAACGVEDQGIPLEQTGELLVADVAGAVGPAARQAVCLDEAGTGLGLGELGVDQVHVCLLEGDLAGHLGTGSLGGPLVLTSH